jgi:hypothetical protein
MVVETVVSVSWKLPLYLLMFLSIHMDGQGVWGPGNSSKFSSTKPDLLGDSFEKKSKSAF